MKTSILSLAFFGSLILILTGCDETKNHERAVKELLEVDLEFANHSKVVGSHTAFLDFIDDSCVLLRPKRMPVVGRANIAEMFSTPDTSFTLDWTPLFADISKSGDLGYTYGIYTVEMDSPEGDVVTKQGTYVTIWKKDKNGNWKFVLDTGNQGLSINKEEGKPK